jgi:hypothetical protein
LNHGKKDYLLGSHPVFELFRAAHQIWNKPYIVGGLLMTVGYFGAMVRGVQRTMPENLITIRRKDQILRLKKALLLER